MRRTSAFAATLAFALLSGCASYNASQSPKLDYSLSAQRSAVQANGMQLMAKPVHQEEELKTYYSNDLVRWEVLPVELYLENGRSEGGGKLYIPREGVSLVDQEGNSHPLLGLEQVMDKAGRSYWRTAGWAFAFGIIGGAISAAQVSQANEKMRTDYSERMYQDSELGPGESVSGVVFFSIPKHLESIDGWHLGVVCTNRQGDKTLLEYPLAGKIALRQDDRAGSGDGQPEI